MVVPSFVFAPLFVLITAFGGVGNDALDYVDSRTYWKLVGIGYSAKSLIPLASGRAGDGFTEEELRRLIEDLGAPEFIKRQRAMTALAAAGSKARPFLEKAQGSDDPEVATAAAKILSKLRDDHGGGNPLHLLMAIRSLGELKSAEAVPHLEKLRGSRELFVSQYASRALSAIRGEEFVPDRPNPDTLQKDLAIAYPSIAAILHARSNPRTGGAGIRGQIDLAFSLSRAMATLDLRKKKAVPDDQEALLASITNEHLGIIRRIGNVRIDSFTAMIPADFSPVDGGIIVIVRGLCDHARSLRFMEEEFTKIAPDGVDPGLEIIRFGEVEWIHQRVLDMEFYVHFPPGGKLLIFVGGTNSMTYLESISNRIMGKDKTPVGGPAIPLLEKIPENASAFLAAQVPAPVSELGGRYSLFETYTGSLRANPDRKLEIAVELGGTDRKRVSEFAGELRLGLGMGTGALAALAAADKRLSGLSEASKTIAVDQDENTVGVRLQFHPEKDFPVSLFVGFNSFWQMLAGKPAGGIDVRPVPEEEKS